MDISQLGSRKIGVHVVFLSKINHIHGFEGQSLILRQTSVWVSSIQTDTLTRKNIRVGRIQSSATQLVHCNGLLGKCSISFLLVRVISTVFRETSTSEPRPFMASHGRCPGVPYMTPDLKTPPWCCYLGSYLQSADSFPRSCLSTDQS